MLQSNDILYSGGNNDECYTPGYAVEPIIKYLTDIEKKKYGFIPHEFRSKLKIRCPFDTGDSEFVKQFKNAGYEVISSHINEGKDFYNYEPYSWDVMISNPPFTNKRKIFERAIKLGKPFALLMSMTWLNDSAPKKLFKDHDLQLLMFDKRIEFIQPGGGVNKKITFSSGYYCHDFLPKQIIMENILINK